MNAPIDDIRRPSRVGLPPRALVAPLVLVAAAVAALADDADEAWRRPWRRSRTPAAAPARRAEPPRDAAGRPATEQRPRTWRDAAGELAIEAVLTGIDLGGVTLTRDDGTVVALPLESLGHVDRLVALRELRRLERGRPEGFAGAVADVASQFRVADPAPPEPFVAIPAEAEAPGSRRPANASWSLARGDAKGRVTGLFPAGDEEDDWVLVEVGGIAGRNGDATRLRWLRPPGDDGGESPPEQALPPGERVLDYHPVLELLLTTTSEPIGGVTALAPEAVTLWDASPRESGPAPLARWTVALRPGLARPWARIVDDGLVLFVDRDMRLVCFDAWTAKSRWRTPVASAAEVEPTLDGARRRIVVAEDGGVRVLDPRSGAALATVSSGERAASAALAPDGARLAVVAGGRILVHDLTRPAEPPAAMDAPASDPLAGSVAWMGDAFVAASNRGGPGDVLLYAPDRARILWRYTAPERDDGPDTTSTLVPGGMLSFAPPPFAETRVSLGAVVATRIPEPAVLRAATRPDNRAPAAVAPGTAIGVYTLCGDHDAEVRGVLLDIIRRNGWVYDKDAPLTLAGYLFEQDPETVSAIPPRSAGRLETVRPVVASIRVVTRDRVLYEKSSGNLRRRVFTLSEGETLSSHLERVLPPGASFFRGVVIPDTIPDPGERYGLGTRELVPRDPVRVR